MSKKRAKELYCDTKGSCFLCRTFTKPSKFQPNNGTSIWSLRLLSRFLALDLRSVFEEQRWSSEVVNVAVPLCQDCLPVISKFDDLFQEYDLIRLQIHECLKRVQEVLEESDKSQEVVSQFHMRVISAESQGQDLVTVLEKLRTEISEKCFQKTGSEPLDTYDELSNEDKDESPDWEMDSEYSENSSNPGSNLTATTITSADVVDEDPPQDDEVPADTIEMRMLHLPTSSRGGGSVPQERGEQEKITFRQGSDKMYKCDQCGKVVGSTLASMNAHKARHHQWDDKHIKCPYCSAGFKHPRYLRLHKVSNHKETFFLPFKPPGLSTAQFTNRLNARFTESKSVDVDNPKQFVCNYCKTNFKLVKELDDHLIASHLNDILRHIGVKVDKVSLPVRSPQGMVATPYSVKSENGSEGDGGSSASSVGGSSSGGGGIPVVKLGSLLKGDLPLLSHLQAVKVHRCGICKKTFHKASLLTYHKRLHSGEKPFQCTHCPEAFSYGGSLQTHIQLSHRSILMAQYKEPETTEKEFGDYIKVLLKRNTDAIQPKVRACRLCTKSYTQTRNVEGHLVQSHLEELGAQLLELQRTKRAHPTSSAFSSISYKEKEEAEEDLHEENMDE